MESPAERKPNKRCIMLLTIRKQLYDFLLFLIFILASCPKTPVSPPASQNLNGAYRPN